MAVEDTQPLISHLIELRKRLLNCIITVLVVFLVLVFFANDIYQLVSAPLIKQLPAGSSMIATDVASPFFTPIKLTMMVSVFVSAPMILYQVWAFIAPGLYKHEKHYAVPVILMSAIFFVAGATFAYKIAFPRACEYLLGLQQSGKFQTLINAEDYFDLIIMIMLGLGVVFQIPSLSFLLGRIGLVTAGTMLKTWRYAIVIILIIAAVLTPTPDPYNLMIFALPMVALYLVSIGIVWIFGKPRQTDEEYETS